MLVLLIGLQNAHSQQSKLSAFLKWGGGGRNGTRGKERMESKQRSAPRETIQEEVRLQPNVIWVHRKKALPFGFLDGDKPYARGPITI